MLLLTSVPFCILRISSLAKRIVRARRSYGVEPSVKIRQAFLMLALFLFMLQCDSSRLGKVVNDLPRPRMSDIEMFREL